MICQDPIMADRTAENVVAARAAGERRLYVLSHHRPGRGSWTPSKPIVGDLGLETGRGVHEYGKALA